MCILYSEASNEDYDELIRYGLYGEVRGVYTLPEYRGKGISTQLMLNFIECAKKIGLSSIQFESTTIAYSIYKKWGLRIRNSRLNQWN